LVLRRELVRAQQQSATSAIGTRVDLAICGH